MGDHMQGMCADRDATLLGMLSWSIPALGWEGFQLGKMLSPQGYECGQSRRKVGCGIVALAGPLLLVVAGQKRLVLVAHGACAFERAPRHHADGT